MGVDITILAEDAEPVPAGRSTWHLVGPPAFTDWSTVVRPPDVDTATWELRLRAVFEDVEPFGRSEHRVYKWFGFLADVRTPGPMPCISPPRGLPDDLSEASRTWLWWWEWRAPRCTYGHTWLLTREIRDYDYDQLFLPVGASRRCTLREYLGDDFFTWLRSWGVESDVERRLVIFFDV